MRMIPVDHARSHQAAKRGAGSMRITPDEAQIAMKESGVDVPALNEANERFLAESRRAPAGQTLGRMRTKILQLHSVFAFCRKMQTFSRGVRMYQ
jgi:hypothetical protein